MSLSITEIRQRAEQEFTANRFGEAEEILRSGGQSFPNSADLACDLAWLLTFTQREPESVDLVPTAKTSSRFQELGTLLVEHFSCRRSLARKLGIEDAQGEQLLARCLEHTGLTATTGDISLSACLIVRDEAANLERCLTSLKGLVTEIVVVDTGSIDGTLEIARAFGAKTDQIQWTGDFSAARNVSLHLASSRWALWIDADEAIEPSAISLINEGLMRPQFGGYFMKIVNFMSEQELADQYVHSAIRLFQRLPGVSFQSRIHEQVLPSITELGLKTASISAPAILHYGYTPEQMQSKNKLDRTIKMLKREVEEFPEDPFHWFNLANAYIVARKPEEAAIAARKSADRTEGDTAFASLNYHLLASALTDTGRMKEALEACDEAQAKGHGGILTEFERVRALLELGKLEDALGACQSCMELPWTDDLTGDYGIFTHKREVLMGRILAAMGRHEEAIDWLDRSLAVCPTFRHALYAKGLSLVQLGDDDRALPLLESCTESSPSGLQAMAMAAGIYAKREQFTRAADLLELHWKSGGRSPDTFTLWAMVSERLGEPQRLLAAYEAFNREGAMNAEVLINWGRALRAAGEKERALSCFSEAVKRAPEDANAHFNCGDLLYELEQFSDAAHLYQAGLRLQPENASGWFVMGNCLYRMGLGEGAVASFKQALQINPGYREARSNLALVEAELEEAQAA